MGFTRSLREALRTGSALQRYIRYIEEAATQPPQLNTRGPRGNMRDIVVIPFSFDIPTGETILTKVSQRSWTPLSTAIGTFADVTIPATGAKKRPGFKAAKVVYFTSATRTVSTPVSNRTGLEYMKYEGETYTAPFGRAGANDDEYDVYMQIRSALLPSTYTGIRRVSLTVERVRER